MQGDRGTKCESNFFRRQLVGATLHVIDESGSMSISTSTSSALPTGMYAEAEAKDADGQRVYGLPYVTSGRLKELEFFRGDGHPVIADLFARDFHI